MKRMERRKIVFVSNFLSPHQKPFCDEMYRLCEGDFHFIATKPMDNERKRLGYSDLDETAYVIRAYESAAQKSVAQDAIAAADVIIIGSALDAFIIPHLKTGKMIFKYSERLLKKALTPRTFLRFICGTWLHHGRFSKYPVYMLCASAFTAHDFARLGYYKDKLFCWGYFPDLRLYDDVDALLDRKKKNTILWAGRFIDWKHPEYCIQLAQVLKEQGYAFEINMIGTGEMQESIREMIKTKGLDAYVHVLGSMSPQMVRDYMEASAVHIITSNREEGWGAVLNESMNSACAVVAGSLVGAAPYLIDDTENGLLFQNEDVTDLIVKVKRLLDNPEWTEKIGKNAYATIRDTWNYKVAAGNLLSLIQNLEKGEEVHTIVGPCQPAPIIADDWYEWKKT